jgi:uncharacterized membrane protein
MPYCSQCGNQVGGGDVFCAKCGARQPVAAAAGPRIPFSGITPRAASMLCYVPVAGWVASILVLASRRFRDHYTVRFHAFQGLYLFVAWLLLKEVIGPFLDMLPGPMDGIDRLLQLAIIGVWIFMMIQASHERAYALPIVGELADKSAK